jgi:diadenosine tetraphosphate (Ap4A) HIT family hydrolase
MFKLDPKLEDNKFFIADMKISRLLLANDANYLWLILVPRKANLVELIDLSFEEQTEVLREINVLSKILLENFGAEKLNIATIGNVVPQLHIHVISRKKNDVTFPKPIWGAAPAKAFEDAEAKNIIEKLRILLPSGK